MIRKIIILIIGILILSNCKQKTEIVNSFEDVQINTYNLYLTLPIGIVKIVMWENFDKEKIIADLYSILRSAK
jgi:hypothetical protein